MVEGLCGGSGITNKQAGEPAVLEAVAFLGSVGWNCLSSFFAQQLGALKRAQGHDSPCRSDRNRAGGNPP